MSKYEECFGLQIRRLDWCRSLEERTLKKTGFEGILNEQKLLGNAKPTFLSYILNTSFVYSFFILHINLTECKHNLCEKM